MGRGQNPTYELMARTPKATKQKPQEGSERALGRIERGAGTGGRWQQATSAGPVHSPMRGAEGQSPQGGVITAHGAQAACSCER